MSFNIFGPANRKDIRLGYIHPDEGYIRGVTVCGANRYAFMNPGAVFILETRDSVRYITINEVNKLTPDDLLPENTAANASCEGIRGLIPEENDVDCKARIQITGGGGVGAVANPIIGRDGSLLAVDLERGGFGYKTAPNVRLIDDCKRGSGAVLRAVIGELPPTVEYFDQEEDFEEYDFSLCGENIAGYGDRFGPDGEDLGPWDPTLFATFAEDPIKRRIQDYQEFLQQLQTPWWTTRKEKPLTVTFRDKTNRVKHDVSHPAWDKDFMNKYAISPVPPSNVRGSDFAGHVCTFEWAETFPHTGEYVFRGMGDNVAKIYLDNELLFETRNFRGGPKDKLTKTVEEGVHFIKVDLLNVPIKEKIRVKPPQTQSQNRAEELLISYRGMSEGSGIKLISPTEVGIDDDIKPSFDKNVSFKILSSTVNARFSSDGKKLLYNGSGKITIEMKYDDKPSISGLAITDIEVGGKVWAREFTTTYNSGKGGGRAGVTKNYKTKGKVVQTIDVVGVSATQQSPTQQSSQKSTEAQEVGSVFNTIDFINKADRKLWRTNVYGRGGFLGEYGICPFNTTKPLPDNPYAGTHNINWKGIDIPVDGNYQFDVEVDDRVKITMGDQVIEKNGFKGDSNRGTGKSSYIRFFRKGRYDLNAELYQKPGGRFSFETGSTSPSKARVNARFTRRGGDIFLVVDGSGSAELDFSLRVDDNPRISGDSLSSVTVGGVTLSRTRDKRWDASGKSRFQRGRDYIDKGFKEKETITGSGTFEAGQSYKVDIRGSSPGSGQRVNPTSIQFDDNIDNGFDLNAELKILRIKNEQSAPVKGVNPMALAINITAQEVERTVISPKSWNDNPMGVAFTIDAPDPPIPQEPIPPGIGRCPRNPFWTTRFPGASESWYPVTLDERWSKFMNRFALSPLAPRNTLNSDGGGGIVYSNTWNLDIPYGGFYGIKGTCDNFGRILIDNEEVYKLKGFKNASPEIKKVGISSGPHTITVEVENQKTRKYKTIQKKIFHTQDWAASASTSNTGTGELTIAYRGLNSANKKLNVDGNSVKLKDGDGNDTNAKLTILSSDVNARFSSDGKKIQYNGVGNISVRLQWDDNPRTAGVAVKSIEIGGKVLEQKGRKGKDTIKVSVKGAAKIEGGIQSGTTKNGVTYSGPDIFNFNHKAWSSFMNRNNVSPFLPPLTEDNPAINGTKTFTWNNVNFTENGQYSIKFQADNIGRLFINGTKVAEARSFRGKPIASFVNLSRGRYEVKVELENVPTGTDKFVSNPTGFAIRINAPVLIAGDSKSWTDNPVGVSAVLIPPPCPKVIEGKGVVTDIIPEEPGNGFTPPPGGGYPVTLRLKDVIPTAGGINYSPGEPVLVDGIPIVPELGNFGQVVNIPVPDNLFGFTNYPNVDLPSATGVGFRGQPVFEAVRVPEDVLPDEQVLQVTDLVGLKQTGYVNGKPYYGSTFFKDGIRYAGVYETIGELIQVYDTQIESINAEVTTRPSAIRRQGTDVTSNDPRLNLPGTPDNLI